VLFNCVERPFHLDVTWKKYTAFKISLKKLLPWNKLERTIQIISVKIKAMHNLHARCWTAYPIFVIVFDILWEDNIKMECKELV
jgi:hypothetical protein